MSKWVLTSRRGLSGKNQGRLCDGPPRWFDSGANEVTPTQLRKRMLGSLAERAEAHESNLPPLVLLFIHGYNVDFEDSLRWLDEIDADITSKLGRVADTVLYSWPSAGKTVSYYNDQEDAVRAAPVLAKEVGLAMDAIRKMDCPAQLAVIAHSMGNRVLVRAAEGAWAELGRPEFFRAFSEALMVGADVDAEAMQPGRHGNPLARLCRRVHVYYNKTDPALAASKLANMRGPRLGRTGPAKCDQNPANLASVDCTKICAVGDAEDRGAHSGFFDSPVVLEDFRQVLMNVDRSSIPGRSEIGHHRFELEAP